MGTAAFPAAAQPHTLPAALSRSTDSRYWKGKSGGQTRTIKLNLGCTTWPVIMGVSQMDAQNLPHPKSKNQNQTHTQALPLPTMPMEKPFSLTLTCPFSHPSPVMFGLTTSSRFNYHFTGAPGWLSRLSVRLQLRSRSRCP